MCPNHSLRCNVDLRLRPHFGNIEQNLKVHFLYILQALQNGEWETLSGLFVQDLSADQRQRVCDAAVMAGRWDVALTLQSQRVSVDTNVATKVRDFLILYSLLSQGVCVKARIKICTFRQALQSPFIKRCAKITLMNPCFV